MATTYWTSPLGALFKLQDGDGPDPSWTELSETAWDAALSDAEIAIGVAYEANANAACADRKQAYDELKASHHTDDWPEHLFVFLTGSDGSPC